MHVGRIGILYTKGAHLTQVAEVAKGLDNDASVRFVPALRKIEFGSGRYTPGAVLLAQDPVDLSRRASGLIFHSQRLLLLAFVSPFSSIRTCTYFLNAAAIAEDQFILPLPHAEIPTRVVHLTRCPASLQESYLRIFCPPLSGPAEHHHLAPHRQPKDFLPAIQCNVPGSNRHCRDHVLGRSALFFVSQGEV